MVGNQGSFLGEGTLSGPGFLVTCPQAFPPPSHPQDLWLALGWEKQQQTLQPRLCREEEEELPNGALGAE